MTGGAPASATASFQEGVRLVPRRGAPRRGLPLVPHTRPSVDFLEKGERARPPPERPAGSVGAAPRDLLTLPCRTGHAWVAPGLLQPRVSGGFCPWATGTCRRQGSLPRPLHRPTAPGPPTSVSSGRPWAKPGWPVGMTPSGSREAQAWPGVEGQGSVLLPAPPHERQPGASCLPSPALSFLPPGRGTQPTWCSPTSRQLGPGTEPGLAWARPGRLQMAAGWLTAEATGPGPSRPPRLQRP